MDKPSPDRWLAVWEAGARRHPLDRALLLFALASPDTPVAELADAPLGERNAALMALRSACFGGRLSGWCGCPACGERMSVALTSGDLPPPPAADGPVVVDGHGFARPTSRHLAMLAGIDDPDAAADALLAACALHPAALPDDRTALRRAVAVALDEADPWADLSLDLVCPACGDQQATALDIAALLWEELDAYAGRLLDDVHQLAWAYGWTEAEILALGEARRAAYLARTSGGRRVVQ
ncbi:MAG: hypothetical protein KDH15_21840 [Rhodocyclaceae bacterium]|nr:hypothetical protein [Rhodocyclaceae bacterium]